MAKRKRRSRPKPNSTSTKSPVAIATPDDDPVTQDAAERYLGQWNRLVSTTNWEKGRIICGWRDALMASGAAVTEYSDEAWTQLVGGVTSQHIGRLRRVFQRFGEAYDQYEGLYWSHFQAALDWDDAEMWLEGAIQNEWSVSQMRGKRWETLGTPPEEQRSEVAQDAAASDQELFSDQQSSSAEATLPEKPVSVTASATEMKSTEKKGGKSEGKPAKETSAEKETLDDAQPALRASNRKPLPVDVEKLPDDLAEAFEAFKLAIIAHRAEGWSDATPELVVECLDALKELALADAD